MLSFEKIFNTFNIGFSVSVGTIVYLLGGNDLLLKTITIIIVLDYITGILKAVYLKQISSSIGFKGIIKKITMFIVICLSYCIQVFVNNTIPIREIVITFFIVNEGISILENASVLIPIPEKLKDILLQLKDKSNEK